MRNNKILISGVGIGGPALAYWLHRYGCDVTIVEKARAVRPGGQAIDFKGEIHTTVLDRMGIHDDVRRLQTGGNDIEIVDSAGRRIAVMPGEFTGGEVEIARGDLARLLYERTADRCEYVFGDSITSITETGGGVHVTFERGVPRTFDLVIGADGIHSNVRRLVFGPESDYVRHLGHYYALADIPEELAGRGKMYNEPGRMVSTGGPKAAAFFVFASPRLEFDRYDPAEMKRIVSRVYAGMGWRTADIIDAACRSDDLYLDSISQVTMPAYTKGRVALIGDAAYGNTLGGFGSGLAMVAGYVLAGELAAAGGDHRVAFRRYEEDFRDYAKISRNANAGRFLAPRTARGIWMRNRVFTSGLIMKMMTKMGDSYASDITLRDYSAFLRR